MFITIVHVFLLIFFCTFAVNAAPLSIVPTNPVPVPEESRAVHSYNGNGKSSSSGSDGGVAGVWGITKIASLLGPTIAIALYDEAHHLYERYEPFITAAIIDAIQGLCGATNSPYMSKPVVWMSSMPPSHSNPHVTRVANEIVRITNARLRERAVISRIQMDDDQYEFSKATSATEVRNTALRVLRAVLNSGSGQFLGSEEKAAVHALISSSIY